MEGDRLKYLRPDLLVQSIIIGKRSSSMILIRVAVIRRMGREILHALPLTEPRAMPDALVLAMVADGRENLEDSISLPAAAERAGPSSERARHIYVAQSELPFKTYVLWLRIERATELYAAGHSLTEAAHEVGFADSAHFSRTFRRTFSLPAAALRLCHG